MYAEGWYASQHGDETDIRLGDWIIQRRCPHLQADLSRFGTTDGTTLTCTVHGCQFACPPAAAWPATHPPTGSAAGQLAPRAAAAS